MTEGETRSAGRFDRLRALVPPPVRGVLLAGVLVQVLLIVLAHVPEARELRGDENLYHARALLVARGVFPEPDFLWPPLQSSILGQFYRLFGTNRIPFEIFQSLLILSSALLLGALARRIGLGAGASAVAAAMLLLDPQVAAFAQYVWPEVPHLFFTLTAMVLLFDADGPPSTRRLFWGGVAFGTAILLKSVFSPLAPLLVVAVVLSVPSLPVSRRLTRALVVAIGLALTLAPVAILHGLETGTWRIAASGPLNLRIGLSDPAERLDRDRVAIRETKAFMERRASLEEKNRELWEYIRRDVRERGIAKIIASQAAKQYGRLLDRESFFTDQLPGGRWGPRRSPSQGERLLRAWALSCHAVALALFGFGLFQVRWGAEGRKFLIPFAVLAYGVALFLGLHVKTRFRVAFWPLVAIFAAVAVDRLFREIVDARQSSRFVRPGPKALLGLVAAAFLLALAFEMFPSRLSRLEDARSPRRVSEVGRSTIDAFPIHRE